MTTNSFEEKLIYGQGRRGEAVPVNVFQYPASVVASAENDQITPFQFRKTLNTEYPGLDFSITEQRGQLVARAPFPAATNCGPGPGAPAPWLQ